MAAPGGRIPKLEPATQKIITDCVVAGMPYRFAAAQAGIGESTFYLWMSKGRKKKGKPYVEFLASIKKAESDFIQRNAKRIEAKADGSWQAAAWLLERRFPDEYGAGRYEIAELKKQVAGLLKVVQNVHGKGTDSARKAGNQAGGKAGKKT